MCVWGGWDSRAPHMPCVCAGGLQALLRAWLCSLQCVRVCPVGAAASQVPPPHLPGPPGGLRGGLRELGPGEVCCSEPRAPRALGGFLQAVLR